MVQRKSELEKFCTLCMFVNLRIAIVTLLTEIMDSLTFIQS